MRNPSYVIRLIPRSLFSLNSNECRFLSRVEGKISRVEGQGSRVEGVKNLKS